MIRMCLYVVLLLICVQVAFRQLLIEMMMVVMILTLSCRPAAVIERDIWVVGSGLEKVTEGYKTRVQKH